MCYHLKKIRGIKQMEEKKPFISELEECIMAGTSSPNYTPKYTSEELAEKYLNGEYDEIESEEYYEGYDDEEDLVQVIYIDDANFSKLDPVEIKSFIKNLSIILGTSPYSEDEINRFISQCRKSKD